MKNPSHGIIVDTNTVLSQTVILDRTYYLTRSIRNFVVSFSQNNQLVLFETKIGGFFGETLTLNLFDQDQAKNDAPKIVCYDMIYLRNFDSMVLGCLDQEQGATTQYYWVYDFSAKTLKKFTFPQDPTGLTILTLMTDMSDGLLMYTQNLDIP